MSILKDLEPENARLPQSPTGRSPFWAVLGATVVIASLGVWVVSSSRAPVAPSETVVSSDVQAENSPAGPLASGQLNTEAGTENALINHVPDQASEIAPAIAEIESESTTPSGPLALSTVPAPVKTNAASKSSKAEQNRKPQSRPQRNAQRQPSQQDSDVAIIRALVQ